MRLRNLVAALCSSTLLGTVFLALPLNPTHAAGAGSVGFAIPDTIHYYVEQGNMAQVTHLLRANPALREQRQTYLGTPLAVAAENARLDMVKFLIGRGANVNARCADEYDSQTVLECACRGTQGNEAARVEVVRLLLSKGALIRSVDRSGYTALHTAAYWGHADVVAYLLVKGADLMVFDTDGRTPFMEAMRGAQMWDDWRLLRFIRVAIAEGDNPNARTASGDTMLDLAVKAGHLHTADFLIANGADVKAKDRYGRTPLALALLHHQDAIADLLRQHGATAE